MRKILFSIIGLLLVNSVVADCVELPGTGIISESIKLCSDTYDAAEGIEITADNIELNCGTAVIRGNYQEKIGIKIENRQNVTITRCNILTYNVGVYISNSSNIYLYDNALLKNDVGVRMYNAYENVIEKHNDKSLIKPVSAISSKFNIVMLGNKNIEREFCEVNACNTYKDMNVCVDNDFYCSPKCTEETDNDCGEKTKEITEEVPKETPKEEITKTNISEEPTEEPVKQKNSKRYLIYPIFYLIGLIIFQFIHYVKKFDEEDR